MTLTIAGKLPEHLQLRPAGLSVAPAVPCHCPSCLNACGPAIASSSARPPASRSAWSRTCSNWPRASGRSTCSAACRSTRPGKGRYRTRFASPPTAGSAACASWWPRTRPGHAVFAVAAVVARSQRASCRPTWCCCRWRRPMPTDTTAWAARSTMSGTRCRRRAWWWSRSTRTCRRPAAAVRLHRSRVVVARETDAALLESPAEQPGEVQRADRAPGGRSGARRRHRATRHRRAGRRRWPVRSGITAASGSVPAWSATGCSTWSPAARSTPPCPTPAWRRSRSAVEPCTRSLSRDGILGFAQPAQLVVPIPGSPLMAINSAIEVDLVGQVNAEFLGERYVGAVGGQTDYFRAARRSAGGLAILALPASTGARRAASSRAAAT